MGAEVTLEGPHATARLRKGHAAQWVAVLSGGRGCQRRVVARDLLQNRGLGHLALRSERACASQRKELVTSHGFKRCTAMDRQLPTGKPVRSPKRGVCTVGVADLKVCSNTHSGARSIPSPCCNACWRAGMVSAVGWPTHVRARTFTGIPQLWIIPRTRTFSRYGHHTTPQTRLGVGLGEQSTAPPQLS